MKKMIFFTNKLIPQKKGSTSACRRRDGFTLIELLVVISIFSLMASIVLSATNNVRSTARDSSRISTLNTVQTALELYYSDYGEYPRVYTPINSGSHRISDWSSEQGVFDNIATNWDGLLAVLEQGKYIARAETAIHAESLANRTTSDRLLSFVSPPSMAEAYTAQIQDPLFPARSYAYMPSSEDNPPYQNYRIRAHLENENSSVLKNAIAGKFLTIDDDVGPPNYYENSYSHLLCAPTKGYYCIGPKRETFSGFEPGKPVIYLYPTETTDVSVKVTTKSIDESIPPYGDGWNVTAHPDGSIINHTDGLTYPYLFWEGKSGKPIVDRSQGFVVPTKDVRMFLASALAKQGLLPIEYDEFIDYWAPRMTTDKPYVYVYFMPKNDYDKLVPMIIKPSPDTVIRVYMLFKPLDTLQSVTPQVFHAPARVGFTVVEWGGDRSVLK
ncbi:MAG: type II secretion system protein [Candidatus Paceibacterota bacterium]|jgi:prepilin-type N-terminal cleavage/methylation domain-containing protein